MKIEQARVRARAGARARLTTQAKRADKCYFALLFLWFSSGFPLVLRCLANFQRSQQHPPLLCQARLAGFPAPIIDLV